MKIYQDCCNSALLRLEAKKRLMVDYLQSKLKDEDWHGVEDAASDIRDIEAQIEMVKWFMQE